MKITIELIIIIFLILRRLTFKKLCKWEHIIFTLLIQSILFTDCDGGGKIISFQKLTRQELQF